MLTVQGPTPSHRPPPLPASRAPSSRPTPISSVTDAPAAPALQRVLWASEEPAAIDSSPPSLANTRAKDAESLGMLATFGRTMRAGFDAMLGAAARVTGREPPGLRAVREETIETLTGRRNTLGAVSKGLGLASRLGSEDPVLESSKWAAGNAVGDVAEKATLAKLLAAGRGASAVAGGFVAGEMVGTAVEEIIDGFVKTDGSQWSPETSLNDRTRANARRGAGLFREAISRKTPWGVAGGLFTATYNVIGSDLKATSGWVLDRLGSRG